jgi:hypothetical protein
MFQVSLLVIEKFGAATDQRTSAAKAVFAAGLVLARLTPCS